MARRFEFSEGSSNKFWEVWCEGSALHTRYGKLGANGQTTVKAYSSAEAAALFEAMLIKQKTKKGYVETTAAPVAPKEEPARAPKPKMTPFLTRIEQDAALRKMLAKTDFSPEDPKSLVDWADLELDVRESGYLRVSGPVVDVSWVALLPKVTVLELEIVDKTDLAPLAQVKSLEHVKLEGTTKRAVDLSFASSLPKLQKVELRGPRVDSLAPLKSVRTLQEVTIANGAVSDLSPLENLPKLKSLFLPNHRLTSLAPLAKHSGLTYLQVPGNQIEDVAPLAKHVGLRFVGLKGNKVKDVSPLRGLVDVTTMYLEGNPVTDTSPLSALDKLETKDFRVKAGAKPTLTPQLKQRLDALATTPECRALLSALLEKLREVRTGKVTTVKFDADDDAVIALELTAPAKKAKGPASLVHVMTKCGASVHVDASRPGVDGPRVGPGADVEWDDEDTERFEGFCNAGQNWFVFDHQKKNKLGEPGIVFFSHEGALDPKQRFPQQDQVAFGVGGFVLRALAFRVFSKDKRWRGCGWG